MPSGCCGFPAGAGPFGWSALCTGTLSRTGTGPVPGRRQPAVPRPVRLHLLSGSSSDACSRSVRGFCGQARALYYGLWWARSREVVHPSAEPRMNPGSCPIPAALSLCTGFGIRFVHPEGRSIPERRFRRPDLKHGSIRFPFPGPCAFGIRRCGCGMAGAGFAAGVEHARRCGPCRAE